MDTGLNGRRVLVTGASGGIGRAITAAFLAEGASVAVHARTEEKSVAVAEAMGAGCVPVFGDLGQAESATRIAEMTKARLGGLDILINNAGIYETAPIGKVTEADWDRTFAVNTKAPFLLTQACLPMMEGEGSRERSVLFISSTSDKDAAADHTAYNASKHAVRGLARCLAVELAPLGIRVNCVAPGWVDTPMADRWRTQYAAETQVDADIATDQMRAGSMLGEILPPEAVADMVVFLSSDRGRHITAQSVSVCNGTTHWG
ncbi:SDR family oxidoreductase [Rhodospirillaceae bacterium KN72]|uniref:SDR family oxidoreductase n=1 Tax=Pacificispira spongiicola TaxID=2729598 RepID=A0A7Y0DZ65_9PROT|nr:SDR family oxidoreductase [Pacificispira spongiicola]NMM44178.1 SDR family oxidoreductase [Pacificispira spongiicola]